MGTKLSGKNKIGLVLAVILGLGDVASLGTLGQQLEPGQDGPPAGVTIFSALLGVVTLVAVVIAWRSGSRVAVRVLAGARILSMILGLPAFFVSGVPSGFVVISAIGVVLTLVCLALVLSRPASVDGSSSSGASDRHAGVTS
jgi:hypothetical protein